MEARLRSLVVVASLVLLAAPRAARACAPESAPCIDAEALWLSSSPGRFSLVSNTTAPPALAFAASATLGGRYRPGVLNVPAPNAAGRDVNVLRFALDLTLTGRLGLGRGLELTLLTPAGLDQRGSGIKGVTSQTAEPISSLVLRDPRLGFGYAVPLGWKHVGLKLRFEAKLPLGDQAALAGEMGPVASPSVALSWASGGAFLGAELGARLRKPTGFFGSRIGSQAAFGLGAGYELDRPRLAFTLEAYVNPNLIRSPSASYVPAEWFGAVGYSPNAVRSLYFGLGGGTGLPLANVNGDSAFAFGVPMFRANLFARWTPE